LAPSIDEFFDAIKETFKRGGNVIMPTFALERAKKLLYFLSQGIADKRIPESTPVYLDSPMAISATEIFRRYPQSLSRTPQRCFRKLRERELLTFHDHKVDFHDAERLKALAGYEQPEDSPIVDRNLDAHRHRG
jgi:predicted metal-dependent RNase